ncbi:MAG: hypothetical protein ACAI44_31655 [Candidatus Sericytochromatia bacterium]
MRKKVLALILALLPGLTGCEQIQKMMEGPSKEKYAYDYAEAWLDLRTIVNLTQTPQIDQKKYVRQLQATEVDIHRHMDEYAERPEAQSESYKTLFTIVDHYKHAAEVWKDRKGAMLVMQQFEEAEDLFPKAAEAYQHEYEQPLDEMVTKADLARIAAFEAERAKQEDEKKKKEAAAGKSGH